MEKSMLDPLEELRELKIHLKTTVDELLSLRNRLAEYDSEFIGRLDDLEVDINKYAYLSSAEKDMIRERLLYDCDNFKKRINEVISGLDRMMEKHTNELFAINARLEQCLGGCPQDMKHTLVTLRDVYAEHIDVFDGMKKIYTRYVNNLSAKLKTV